MGLTQTSPVEAMPNSPFLIYRLKDNKQGDISSLFDFFPPSVLGTNLLFHMCLVSTPPLNYTTPPALGSILLKIKTFKTSVRQLHSTGHRKNRLKFVGIC